MTDLHYVGSLTVDQDLLDAAGILPYERVYVANVHTGQRFDTYAMAGPRGSGMVCLNGAAARLAEVGDVIIIFTYAWVSEEELSGFRPRIVLVDDRNRITEVREERVCGAGEIGQLGN
jgi:aspartate 1-decarboxylase